MKKQLLRYINILKTIPEIKESIEELKFGCLFKYEKEWDSEILTFCSLYNDTGMTMTLSYLIPSKERTAEINNFAYDFHSYLEIIGQVEERHLRMFLLNKMNNTSFGNTKLNRTYLYYEAFGDIDNSKSYMEQSETFFKKLNDWLVKEFNIEL